MFYENERQKFRSKSKLFKTFQNILSNYYTTKIDFLNTEYHAEAYLDYAKTKQKEHVVDCAGRFINKNKILNYFNFILTI
jgi:hypothetical protein